MLLKAIIKNISEWKSIINAISNISEEAMFICNSDGITFRGLGSIKSGTKERFIHKSFESIK